MPVKPIAVYLEVGRTRVFAGAVEWPGWCRSGRDERSALAALAASGPRYVAAIGPAARGLEPGADAAGLQVVERLDGDATTDVGAPAVPPAADERPLDGAALERIAGLLRACWAAFDRAAEANVGATLRKGPRGGGRDLDAIVSHVFEADRAYLSVLWASLPKAKGGGLVAEMVRLREAILEALSARARGEPLPSTHRSAKVWTPRYFVRRSAWHALDHAFEIEDRSVIPTRGAP